MFGLVSCGSRTVTGGFSDSPDRQFRVYVRVYGAVGQSFVSETAKTLVVSIVAARSKETLLRKDSYRVQGSDVGWDLTWDPHNAPSITVYDYGTNVDYYRARDMGAQKRVLMKLSYRYDPVARKFKQNPAQ